MTLTNEPCHLGINTLGTVFGRSAPTRVIGKWKTTLSKMFYSNRKGSTVFLE